MGVANNLVIKTNSPLETRALAEAMAKLLMPGDVICLNGDLGAGKTAFSQGVAAGLGVKAPVTSPTFTLINEYHGRMPIFHFDVYRLDGSEQMYDLGYEEYFYGEGICLIEWAERVQEVLPQERLDVFISRHEDSEDLREIKLIPLGERYLLLLEELSNLVHIRN
ncbi:tRNA (adenosine(37)-N6)-threonylcarbamoyltransferase complex ATPase subunit type 1 TsaE [Desulforamulus aquiferis]|uniref:tRNA (adenosine(37)-N6)-threonylcarbamoyltransferase complex ATPase subunit type 1 TsaE n=1 Tax=Desulforamulus aquiferis TaxID=1397668 RepID=UPI0027154195|nr:tRNA (adenosine(37)-N6)-threonylcarbamoyltransferase complex ATPase subunit type 1 TsaE [Desulforamulus aquiferis]